MAWTGKGIFVSLSIDSRIRDRVFWGILRKSFCTAGLNWTLNEPIFAQPPFHIVQTDRFFVPALRDDGKVVEIFHELFVVFQRDNYGLAFSIPINDESLIQKLWQSSFLSHQQNLLV
jgi:hypothetical protein